MIISLRMDKLTYKFLSIHIMSMPSHRELTKPALPITVILLLLDTHSTQTTHESSANTT